MSTGKVHSEKYKNPGQVEFSELFQKLEAAKWTRADVARALHVAGSAVTMILNGERTPRAATLAGMRQLVNQVESGRAHAEEIEEKFNTEDRLNEQLNYLREKDPAGFRVVTTTVDILHKRAQEDASKPDQVIVHEKRKPAPPSSALTPEEKQAAKSYVEKHYPDDASGKGLYPPRPAAAGQRTHTRRPPGPSSAETKAPQPDPEGKGRK